MRRQSAALLGQCTVIVISAAGHADWDAMAKCTMMTCAQGGEGGGCCGELEEAVHPAPEFELRLLTARLGTPCATEAPSCATCLDRELCWPYCDVLHDLMKAPEGCTGHIVACSGSGAATSSSPPSPQISGAIPRPHRHSASAARLLS